MNLSEHVLLLGECSNINELLNIMDIFLFPSKTEGLGISLIEAQINGLLCFTSEGVVPDEVNFTENVNFISLDKSAAYWAEKILEKDYSRKVLKKSLLISKYDINNTISAVEKILLEAIK